MTSLTPDRWQRIEALFSTLVDAPADERASALAAAAAADPDLVATVEGMLAHADGGQRLQQVVDAVAGTMHDAPAALPPRFGAFRTVREVGRGGMGVVYEGVSDDEFARRVAIKMAPLARVGAAADARFRLERQILSSLDHPHIARFLDGGTEGDLPYLVMEFVHGQPITAYVTAKALPLADRLRLVQKLCGALHYAHQRLVVHRDLKPSNILVTDDGTPKLLDFGVARLMDAGDTPYQTLGATAWTPDYASPEQVTGELVGTPSDIYSLGLVLYEVLTGARAQLTDTTSPLALSRSVCEVDPPRPSDRVAAAGDRVLARRLSGDLDTIVMTAIHKDAAQRYASAAAVADDIQRYLDGLPVEARAGSLWYRARKALARHRGAAAAGALVTLAITGGFVSTAYQARRADRRFQQVRALANEFVFGVHDRIAALPGSTEARRALVQTALSYLENLREDAAGDQALAKELAAAYVKVGRVQGYPLDAHLGEPEAAAASFARARGLLTPLAAAGDFEARLSLARLEMFSANLSRSRGDQAGADRSHASALEITTQLRALRPRDEETLDLIGEVNADIARTGMDLRRADEVVAAAHRALEAAEALTALHPGDANRRNNLATAFSAAAAAHMATGQIAEAAASYGRAAAIREALLKDTPRNTDYRRGVIVALGNMGDLLGARTGENVGDYAGAAVAFERAIVLGRQMMAEDPNDRRATFDLVNALLRLGAVQSEMPDRMAEALPTFEEADRLNAALVTGEPGSTRYRYLQVVLDRRIGRVLRLARRDADAEHRLTRCRTAAETMFEGSVSASARQQYAFAGVELAWLWAGRDDRRATALAAAVGEEIVLAKMPPLLEAQLRADLGRVFLALARGSAPDGRHAAAAIAEFDASAGAWRTAATAPAMASQRDRTLAALAADRDAAEALNRR